MRRPPSNALERRSGASPDKGHDRRMTIVAARSDNRQVPSMRPVHNLVPTPETRALATRAIYAAEQRTGADAALLIYREVDPDQLPALLGLVLTATKAHKKLGRPRIPLQFSADERRELHKLYKRGGRSRRVTAGEREYQRVNQRNRRARRKAAL